MIPVLLTQVKTSDGFILDGFVITPKHVSKTAIIWLHGLGSRFSSGQTLIKELALQCSENGFGYLKFNLRGNNKVTSGIENSKNKKFLGSAFERFQDCTLDIRAIINFAGSLGYRNIILAGHSTGSNKALYYTYKTKDQRIKAIALLSPISDIAAGLQRYGRRKIIKAIKIAEKIDKKNPFRLMPEEYGIYSAQRFLSLYRPDGIEDVFPYYNANGSWKELKSIKSPVSVFIGSTDEYLTRKPKNFLKIFQERALQAKKFSGFIIKGAGHSFIGKEKILTRALINWIKNIL